MKKLEKLGLKPRVEELLKSGVTSGREIHRKLTEENPAVEVPSESAVTRYVSELKDLLAPEAARVLKEHVNRTITDDLTQLEMIKDLTYAWGMDEGLTQAERVSAFAARIDGELHTWREKLTEDADDPNAVTAWIIKRAVELLRMDDRRQDERLRAFKEWARVVNLKCSNAGLLGENAGTPIIFEQRASAAPDPPRGGERNFVVLDGREDMKE